MRQITSLFVISLLVAAPAIAGQSDTPQAAQAAPRPAQTTPLRIGGQVKAPERLKYVAPAYPAAALEARVSGIVIIEATIGKDGSVTEAHVIRSIALLDQAALDAVRQWKYTPTTLNGVPVPVIMTVTVNFTPQHGAPRAVSPISPTPQATEAPAARPPIDPRIDQSDVNIKLTIKITDSGSGGTQIKTVSLIMANRGNGRVRSVGDTLAKDIVVAGGTATTGSYRSRSSFLLARDGRDYRPRPVSGPAVGQVPARGAKARHRRA
ncbi:MAG: hypothetical protein B7X11_02810 [Acidobacteria bacterium 37-65-4]|nr:MAG: hypothetical protein B7X11_02810 [Acidobacteria bacterium 37-65-4]